MNFKNQKKINFNFECLFSKFSFQEFFILSLFIVVASVSCNPVKFNVDNNKVSPSVKDNTCTGQDCVYVWKSDKEWSSCSLSCGSGTQTRQVVCIDTKQNIVSDDHCPEKKPAAVQNCNTQSCTTEYKWNPGDWSACSKSCGGGTKTRTITCQKNGDNVSDLECAGVGDKPASSESCNTQTCSAQLVDHTTSITVPAGSNKVDILIVLDDSESMLTDNLKLAQRLSGFVSELKNINIDWNMCITTTDTIYYEGRPLQWSGTGKIVIDKNTSNLSQVFQETIYNLSPKEDDPLSIGSNDERGIKAIIQNYELKSNTSFRCYREDAAVAYIVISDEDERSVGGNKTLSQGQFFDLELMDQPSQVLSILGTQKRVSSNSIVVKDLNCKAKQDAQGTPSFIGTKYMELSNLTKGYSGSICDTNYSTNLSYFKKGITNTLSSVKLDCVPSGTPTVTVPSTYTYTFSGNEVIFTPVLVQGTQVTVKYKCEE